MKKPIVRVTQLEAFRRYITNTDRDRFQISEQSLIDSITGRFKGNSLTKIGTAFHSIIEKGEDILTHPTDGGFRMPIEGGDVYLSHTHTDIALRYRDSHPAAFHEVRLYKDFGPAIITGCADLIDGIEMHDVKTKFSTPSDSEYVNSCQWRYYLDIFEADTFLFDLFIFQGYNSKKHGTDVRPLTLIPHTPPITCRRYQGMEADNALLLDQFIQWATSRNLLKYLIGPGD